MKVDACRPLREDDRRGLDRSIRTPETSRFQSVNAGAL